MFTTKKIEIIHKAASLFRKRGYAGTNIKDLGNEMGTSSAALYYHFENKDSILKAIMSYGITQLKEAVSVSIKGQGSTLEKAQTAIRAHIMKCIEIRDFVVVILNDKHYLSKETRPEIEYLQAEYQSVWQKLFSEMRIAGLLRKEMQPFVNQLPILGALSWVVNWYDQMGPFSPEMLADFSANIILTGILEPQTV